MHCYDEFACYYKYSTRRECMNWNPNESLSDSNEHSRFTYMQCIHTEAQVRVRAYKHSHASMHAQLAYYFDVVKMHIWYGKFSHTFTHTHTHVRVVHAKICKEKKGKEPKRRSKKKKSKKRKTNKLERNANLFSVTMHVEHWMLVSLMIRNRSNCEIANGKPAAVLKGENINVCSLLRTENDWTGHGGHERCMYAIRKCHDFQFTIRQNKLNVFRFFWSKWCAAQESARFAFTNRHIL